MVPHALRLVIGNDQRVLLPACVLAGGTLLLLADTLARTLLAPQQLPVGVITALLGVPTFLLLLLRRGAPAMNAARLLRTAGACGCRPGARMLVDGLDLARAAGRGLGRAGAQRQRQDDAAAHAGRPAAHRRRARSGWPGGRSPTGRRGDAARQRGLLPQVLADAFSARVLDVVLLGRHPHLARWDWESEDDRRIARAALAAVDLAGFEARDVLTLSGGERQRVGLAALLAQDPLLLLLDEPLAHLDLHHQVAAAEHLLRLARERGKAVRAGAARPEPGAPLRQPRAGAVAGRPPCRAGGAR